MTDPRLLDRTIRLFTYLARVQQLKSSPPRVVDDHDRAGGGVVWLGTVPSGHSAVTALHDAAPGPDDVLLAVDRVPRTPPPAPAEVLAPWLDGAADDPEAPPGLREILGLQEDADDVAAHYAAWLPEWQAWADRERRDRPARDLYGKLFSMYVAASGHPEDLELVVGTGCLGWAPEGQPPVRRHLLTSPVAIGFDDDTGRLSVTRVKALDTFTVELDMLDPGRITDPARVGDIRERARVAEHHPLDRAAAGDLARRLVHILDAGGEYRDDDVPPACGARAEASFAPAVILRRRSTRGLVEIFQTIVDQLAETGTVPEGLRPLVDPDHVPALDARPAGEGALVHVDDDPFLPLPANDTQLRILRQVDTKAQTLVQGPPGTGKTHTAAALLSHLLAQGKRVLVTAHTDRALKEVREKLPAEIKPLSVAVVGTSREDMSDLKVAVERIAAAAADHDPQRARRVIQGCLDDIDALRRHRADLHTRLVAAREQEVREHEHLGYRGTLAAIARRHAEEAPRLGWLARYADVPAGAGPPLTDAEAAEWLALLRDPALAADEPEARLGLPDAAQLYDPARFADLLAAEHDAAERLARWGHMTTYPAYGAVLQLDAATRGGLPARLHHLQAETHELSQRPESWMAAALADVRHGRAAIWRSRRRQIAELADRAAPLVDHLGPLTHVEVPAGKLAPLLAIADELYAYLAGGGRIKTQPGGAPKLGPLTARQVKQAQPLFQNVSVDGLPPTTADAVEAFRSHARATTALAALDRAWPGDVIVPTEDTLRERLQWHVTELAQLDRLLRLADAFDETQSTLARLGLPRSWDDIAAIRACLEAAHAVDARNAAAAPIRRLEGHLHVVARAADSAPAAERLYAAVRARDVGAYAEAHRRLARLFEVRRLLARREELGARLDGAAGPSAASADRAGSPARRHEPSHPSPTVRRGDLAEPHALRSTLRSTIESTPTDPAWPARLASFTTAWTHAAVGTWIRTLSTEDVNALRAEVTRAEERVRHRVETLAATRAWDHAVSADRLTGTARANLTHYAQLVHRLGKGTGKYAVQRKAEIRRAMDRCRSAVPVWIMPVYRIAEQLRIHPDMFDVVIVDEASQAGLEATFLQYLAPKIVVIGDDRQVSPSAVGVNQQQLRDLAVQYLADDPYRSAWQDPKRSLFDEAKMRYSGMLTLTEHRRCVPEIVGFSNRVAYEPDGIRLVPVRQFGAERLEPVKPVHLSDGYVRGTTNKVNPVEADAIAAQIEKCIADPRYDGLTFGVISLLGTAQAKAIETLLLDRIPPEEWAARDLRCGDSADFQGSERDVVFLSMVAAPPAEGRRMSVLTGDQYVQRYNVAASRARDQMWLFHSVPLGLLGNKEDMRFQLLDYCYEVSGDDTVHIGVPDAVPDDVPVEPFGSLFEQRVFNRVRDLGYAVVPQYDVEGYRIDLVVVGAKSRLAIECDGDFWHGPDAYERDLARQRDLERCGWRFFRVRESAFYADPGGIVDDLVERLRELGIQPAGG